MGNRAKHNAKPKRDFVEVRELTITKVPAPDNLDLTRTWYLVYTAPRMEFRAARGLVEAGCSVFLPKLHRVIRHRRRLIDHEVATFSRYLFASGLPTLRRDSYLVGPDGKTVVTINGRPLTDIREIEGVQDIVRSQEGWAVVPRRAIERVVTFQNDGALPRLAAETPDPSVSRGDTVRILSGPFMGFQSTVVEAVGLKHADVLIEIFGRWSPATFEVEHLEVVQQSHAA